MEIRNTIPVVCCTERDRARPKSAILQLHSVSKRMFDGF